MKKLQGTVVSTKMNNTVVVEVVTQMKHPVYKKIVATSKRYLADKNIRARIGDKVEIVECPPLSKRKTWKIGSIIN